MSRREGGSERSCRGLLFRLGKKRFRLSLNLLVLCWLDLAKLSMGDKGTGSLVHDGKEKASHICILSEKEPCERVILFDAWAVQFSTTQRNTPSRLHQRAPPAGLGIVIGHITSSISTSRPVGLSQHRTTSCRRTVSHCPATPPAAVELSLAALQHHQLP
ncbi:hypothetical protein XENTR_v10020588 [Xenopus tropicalis]|nr:hypothetical protein XENTR_v10020588 [Xenopus tropicalis]